ncbi:MAG: hypothetical protein LUF00_11035 [Lachnospiraceae bacterium]|nr:hypothetical protein [Lachnospiraceae bacterium]
MKEYEMVREIFNECANNQMRDVFFEEKTLDDTDAYIRSLFQEKQAQIEKSVSPDGVIQYEVEVAGLRQRFTFSEI